MLHSIATFCFAFRISVFISVVFSSCTEFSLSQYRRREHLSLVTVRIRRNYLSLSTAGHNFNTGFVTYLQLKQSLRLEQVTTKIKLDLTGLWPTLTSSRCSRRRRRHVMKRRPFVFDYSTDEILVLIKQDLIGTTNEIFNNWKPTQPPNDTAIVSYNVTSPFRAFHAMSIDLMKISQIFVSSTDRKSVV